MDKRSALRVLLAHSMLSKETQDQIVATIDEMSDEEVVRLGTALAQAKEQQLAETTKLATKIDMTLKELE